MRRLLALVLFAVMPAFAAEFSGNWTGAMKLKRADGVVVEEGKAYLTLQQAGDTVTGKAGQDGFAERQGRWRHAYFQVRDTSNGSLVSVKLVPRGGELVGQAHLEIEGQKLVGELQFKRD